MKKTGREKRRDGGRCRRAALLLLACAAAAFPAAAQHHYGGMGARRGYATDYFEGFDAVDNDTRIPRKEKSFWYSVEEKTPAAQLAYAGRREKEGASRAARKGYEALVREWPSSPEAARAQAALAGLLEREGKYEKAFDEYQYLLAHYAGNCDYERTLDRQFRIANHLLHNNKSMFGFALSGLGPVRERFEQIVRNAPRSPRAPEAMLIIGGIRENEKEVKDAISVYDGLLNRFPNSEQAVHAAYLSAKCRRGLAAAQPDNEARCREAVSFLKALLERRPNHPRKDDLQAWLRELSDLLVEQNYRKAAFYDSRQRSLDAAKAAYRRFLGEFGDSKYAPQVRARLEALEKGAPPLR